MVDVRVPCVPCHFGCVSVCELIYVRRSISFWNLECCMLKTTKSSSMKWNVCLRRCRWFDAKQYSILYSSFVTHAIAIHDFIKLLLIFTLLVLVSAHNQMIRRRMQINDECLLSQCQHTSEIVYYFTCLQSHCSSEGEIPTKRKKKCKT